MTEYIERESVLDALFVFNDYDNGNEHFLYGIETAREIVESMQVADVTPVVHGQWGKAQTRGIVSYADCYAECYACHGKPVFLGWDMKYCPNCGAKMEAGDEK